MENKDAKTCTGSDNGSGKTGHSAHEYENIGFSPCAKYVAHRSDLKCDVINRKEPIEVLDVPHVCQCNTGYCDCGDFLSHKISEPCTAKA
jgi:hypothetical protein